MCNPFVLRIDTSKNDSCHSLIRAIRDEKETWAMVSPKVRENHFLVRTEPILQLDFLEKGGHPPGEPIVS